MIPTTEIETARLLNDINMLPEGKDILRRLLFQRDILIANNNELRLSISVLSVDMHLKSKRPCHTCARISDALGNSFGCAAVNGYRVKS